MHIILTENSIFSIYTIWILRGLDLIENNWINISVFLNASDSLSTISSFNNNNTKNGIINNIQQKAFSLLPRSISFTWIPAYNNIPDNEQADKVAREAATNNIIPKINLTSLNDIIRIVLEQVKKAHLNLWDRETDNKLY